MPYNSPSLNLKNHLVMAPMTRSRAVGNLPNALMAEYYSQRKGAGLIITEGTAPAPEGLGYARIPGIFSAEQIEGWKLTTAAVHQNDSKIFLQLMHTGRIGHPANLPEGARVIGVSAIAAAGQMHTDTMGMQDYPIPAALSTAGVQEVINGYIAAAKNAIAAGFDGVELHAANGYLIEQFLNPNVNDRTDRYGGSVENRSRFALEVAQQVADAIGKEKVGVRISPNSSLGDLQPYDVDATEETYIHLSREFNRIGLAYIHISINPQVPTQLCQIKGIGPAKATIILAAAEFSRRVESKPMVLADENAYADFLRPLLLEEAQLQFRLVLLNDRREVLAFAEAGSLLPDITWLAELAIKAGTTRLLLGRNGWPVFSNTEGRYLQKLQAACAALNVICEGLMAVGPERFKMI